MSEIDIRVENLGKSYQIASSRSGGHYKTLREDFLAAPRRFRSSLRRASVTGWRGGETFWALRNLTFEVKRGEVLGIIGRNGAGKSTLLKILSRITEPSTGRAEIYGRVGSLLEVGTGFHPELTGRENIYLSGAILGMRRSEISRRFDEIVEFAEVQQFIDTPVKRYSSGMYMRLAFAVAAHLESEILVVDEVLAVGDVEFQKKCLAKMEDVAHVGRTVLFVSHNIGAVRSLCSRAMLLNAGEIECEGDVLRVTNQYHATSQDFDAYRELNASQHLRGSGEAIITAVRLENRNKELSSSFLIGEVFNLVMTIDIKSSLEASFWLLVKSVDNNVVVSVFQQDKQQAFFLKRNGIVTVRLDRLSLQPGAYIISAGIVDKNREFVDWAEDIVQFNVLEQFTDGRVFDHRLGSVFQSFDWYWKEESVQ